MMEFSQEMSLNLHSVLRGMESATKPFHAYVAIPVAHGIRSDSTHSEPYCGAATWTTTPIRHTTPILEAGNIDSHPKPKIRRAEMLEVPTPPI